MSIDVPRPREQVYDFLDVIANHEVFNNHFLVDWRYSGPERGIGSRVRVKTRGTIGSDTVDIQVVSARRPEMIAEENVSADGRRRATGTYRLEDLPAGGTRVVFEYAWRQAPLTERLAAPLARTVVRRALEQAMRRLAGLLAAQPAGEVRLATATAGEGVDARG